MKAVTSLVFVSLLLLTACGGGTVAPRSPVIPSPAMSATLGFTADTQPESVTLPSVGGFSGTLQVPGANASTPVALTESTTVPSPFPAIGPPFTATQSVMLYFSGTPSATVTFSGLPGVTIALPSAINPQQSFYVAAYSSRNGWTTLAGPAIVNGTTVSLNPGQVSWTLEGNATFLFALYAGTVMH